MEAYAVAVAALCCVSCGAIAGFIHTARGAPAPERFLPVYVATMAGVAVPAWAISGVGLAAPTGLAGILLTLLVAGAGSVIALWCDRAVRRSARKRARRQPPPRPALAAGTIGASHALIRPDLATSGRWSGGSTVLVLLVIAGALEEVLYRGVLVQLCLDMRPDAAYVTVGFMLVTSAFVLAHLPLGWVEVIAKLPLAVLTLGAVLALGSVLPAIVIHMAFNWRMWHQAAAPVGDHTVQARDAGRRVARRR